MKFSSLFFAVSFILSLQLSFVQTQDITGQWEKYEANAGASSVCCIPDTLTFQNASSGAWTAKYAYASTNDRCVNLFKTQNFGLLDVVQTEKARNYQTQTSDSKDVNYNFEIYAEGLLIVTMPTEGNCAFMLSLKGKNLWEGFDLIKIY